jgi:hypothetical protein
MSVVRNLLTRAYGKTGDGILVWSIPPVATCPGSTELCREACYGRHGRFRTSTVKEALARNLAASGEPDFVARMTLEIRRRGPRGVVRVHGVGDFSDARYALRWVEIAARCKDARLYFYTRSWRCEGILPILIEMARMPNVRAWFSCDAETGLPPILTEGVRIAYLDTGEAGVPDGTGVVFRIRRLRRQRPQAIALKLICPPERPSKPSTTCSECMRCWRDE